MTERMTPEERVRRQTELTGMVACETAAAILVHARSVTELHPVNLTGLRGGEAGYPPDTACARPAAWDTRLPLTAVTCPACRGSILYGLALVKLEREGLA